MDYNACHVIIYFQWTWHSEYLKQLPKLIDMSLIWLGFFHALSELILTQSCEKGTIITQVLSLKPRKKREGNLHKNYTIKCQSRDSNSSSHIGNHALFFQLY